MGWGRGIHRVVLASGLLAAVAVLILTGGVIRRMDREELPLLPGVPAWMGAERPWSVVVANAMRRSADDWRSRAQTRMPPQAQQDLWHLTVNYRAISWGNISQSDIVEAIHQAMGAPANPAAGRLRHVIAERGIIFDSVENLHKYQNAETGRPVTRRDVMHMRMVRPLWGWTGAPGDSNAAIDLINRMVGHSLLPDDWRLNRQSISITHGPTLSGQPFLRLRNGDRELQVDLAAGCLLPPLDDAVAWLQPAGTVHETMANYVQHTDLIVVAEVIDIEREIRGDATVCARATARVKQTIRGPRHEQIRFMLWQDPGITLSDADVLCFLRRRPRVGDEPAFPEAPWELRHSPPLPDLAAAHRSPTQRILEEVRDLARIAANTQGPALCLAWAAPSALHFGPVIADEKLLMQASHWVDDASPLTRAEAADVLGRFPSARSTALLRKLAADPHAADQADLLTGRWRSYPVRAAAYEALREMKAAVPRPIIYEPHELYRAGMPVVRMLAGLGGLLVMTMLLLPRRRFRFGGMLFCGVSIALLVACLAAAGLWLRGRTISDEMRWTTPPRQHQVVSRRGAFEYMRLDGWPEEARLAYAAALHGEAIDNNWHPSRFASTIGPSFLGAARREGNYGPPPFGPSAPGTFRPYLHVRIPCWMAVATLGTIPALCGLAMVARGIRNLRRRRRNCCVGCGYDLRASPHRCPECGRGVPRVNYVATQLATTAQP